MSIILSYIHSNTPEYEEKTHHSYNNKTTLVDDLSLTEVQ